MLSDNEEAMLSILINMENILIEKIADGQKKLGDIQEKIKFYLKKKRLDLSN